MSSSGRSASSPSPTARAWSSACARWRRSGVDVVVDFAGGALPVTQAVLRDGGRHGSIADASVADAGGTYAWVRPDGDDLQVLADLVDAGKLTVPIAEVFPLEQAAEALRLNQTGHVRGKIAINVSR